MEVQTDNAWAVMGCAFNQAKTWHAATEPEKVIMRHLIQGLREANSTAILTNTDALKLQVCRSQAAEKDGSIDSFLVMYTKPGVNNYSGPFLMWREGDKTSGLIIQSPHDGTDNAHESTKRAFQESNAQAMLSNGHQKGISAKSTGEKAHFSSDWAHSRADLGYAAFIAIRNQLPASVHLHVHGCKAREIMVTDAVGWDGAKHDFKDAFMKAAQDELDSQGIQNTFKVTPWRFDGWTIGKALTTGPDGKGRMANQRFVGTEMYVGLHSRPLFLAKVVKRLEADYLKKPRATTPDKPVS